MLNEPRYGLIYDILFNIPMRINTETMYLRCDFLEDTLEYEVYGIWEGYDTNTALFNRNVKQLAQYAGQEYCLLYPVYTEQKGSGQQYEFGQSRTLYRGMSVTEEILPAGTYYLDYLVYDVFQRPITLDRAEMQWDGAHWTMPEGSWTGEQTLDISSYYRTGR